jgi:uncharacterized membrane protein
MTFLHIRVLFGVPLLLAGATVLAEATDLSFVSAVFPPVDVAVSGGVFGIVSFVFIVVATVVIIFDVLVMPAVSTFSTSSISASADDDADKVATINDVPMIVFISFITLNEHMP